jgi:hypothetical protein
MEGILKLTFRLHSSIQSLVFAVQVIIRSCGIVFKPNGWIQNEISLELTGAWVSFCRHQGVILAGLGIGKDPGALMDISTSEAVDLRHQAVG